MVEYFDAIPLGVENQKRADMGRHINQHFYPADSPSSHILWGIQRIQMFLCSQTLPLWFVHGTNSFLWIQLLDFVDSIAVLMNYTLASPLETSWLNYKCLDEEAVIQFHWCFSQQLNGKGRIQLIDIWYIFHILKSILIFTSRPINPRRQRCCS